MPRFVDADCDVCEFKFRDKFMQTVPDPLFHEADDGTLHSMHYVFLPRSRRSTCWNEGESIVVFRDPRTDQIRYPGRNDAATPAGYERVVMRSDKEVAAFEKRYNVRSEARWYDRGSGTKRPDDHLPSPHDHMSSEAQRFASFMRGWRGER